MDIRKIKIPEPIYLMRVAIECIECRDLFTESVDINIISRLNSFYRDSPFICPHCSCPVKVNSKNVYIRQQDPIRKIE